MKPQMMILIVVAFYMFEFLLIAPILTDSFTSSLMTGTVNNPSDSDYSANVANINTTFSSTTVSENPISYLSVIFGFFSFGIFIPDSLNAPFLFICLTFINYFLILLLILGIYMLVRGIG